LSKFEQFEAERLEVRNDAEQRGRSASKPVSTVSLPFSSDTIEGKADRAVAGVDWASEEHAQRVA
jgi:hypothetical protein